MPEPRLSPRGRTDPWREYAACAIEDALTVSRFGTGDADAFKILSSALYVLRNFTAPPSTEPPRRYPDKFLMTSP